MNAISGNKAIDSQIWEKLPRILIPCEMPSKNFKADSINLPKHMKKEILYLTF